MSIGGGFNIIGGGPAGLFRAGKNFIISLFQWGSPTAKNWGESTTQNWG